MPPSHRFRPLTTPAMTAVLIALDVHSALAQRRLTEHTLAADSAGQRPAASLKDIAWLAGHWRGPALGGLSEEIWSTPLAGGMMGSYRLIRNDSIIFYEILTLNQERGSLVVRLKHFNADLTGWEERDQVREFPLVKLEGDRLYFDGMTFERVTQDSIHSYLAIHHKDGRVEEAAFPYRRVRPALTPATATNTRTARPQRR
jgi:Domain of unknown function (DUF6265)